MNKLALLHPLKQSVFGGGEQVTLNLLDGLPYGEFSWTAIGKPGGLFTDELEHRKIQCFDLSILGTNTGKANLISFTGFLAANILASVSLANIVRSQHIDLIYTTSRGALISAALAGGLTRVPVVSHFHDLPRNLWLYAWFAAWGAKTVVVPCEFLKNQLLSQKLSGRRLAKRMRVVFNGVDPQRVMPMRNSAEIRKELGVSENFPVLVSAGRIEFAKGLDILISAMPEILSMFPHAAIVCLGDTSQEPAYYQRMKSQIQDLQIADHVHFPGFRRNPYDYLSAADIVVSTSRAEIFSMVILEAMALSKPVIATNVGGTCEQIDDGINGYLIPINDHDALAKQVIECCQQSPGIRKEMGESGRARVEQQFPASRFTTAMHQVFMDAIS